MANVDLLRLARYGIIDVSPTGQDGDVVVVLRPLSKLSTEERRGLFEMACLSLDGAAPRSVRTSRRRDRDYDAEPGSSYHDGDVGPGLPYDDDDERLIDEA